MEPITRFSARAIALPIENIDTDQIIPARFLKITDKAGLGEALFSDWRYDALGRPNAGFVLNQPAARGAQILVGGHNFGCGSSREHAPWALLAYGFRAVVSTYFADIFRSNSLKNGLIPILVDPTVHARILELIDAGPATEHTVDLTTRTLHLPDGGVVAFPVDPFARHCLLNGLDQLGFLEAEDAAIGAYEAGRHARIRTTAGTEAGS